MSTRRVALSPFSGSRVPARVGVGVGVRVRAQVRVRVRARVCG